MNVPDITVVAVRDVEEFCLVKPVCKFKYVGQVLHIFVEVAGASTENVKAQMIPRPMEDTELIIEAMVMRPVRGFIHYFAVIPIPRHYYLDMDYNVENGEIHLWFLYVPIPPQRPFS